jgi:hypothetical protein
MTIEETVIEEMKIMISEQKDWVFELENTMEIETEVVDKEKKNLHIMETIVELVKENDRDGAIATFNSFDEEYRETMSSLCATEDNEEVLFNYFRTI